MSAVTVRSTGPIVLAVLAALAHLVVGYFYLVGGLASFVSVRAVGALVDRFGSAAAGTAGGLAYVASIWAAFVATPPPLPPLALFVGLMVASAFRNVAANALTSKVPDPRTRARFMSIQSAVQHAASAAGGFLSARLLSTGPGGRLVGMGRVAGLSMLLALALLPLLWTVERRVRARKPEPEPGPDDLGRESLPPPSHAH